MDLLSQARQDTQTITQGEFSTDITLDDGDANLTTVKGLATKHHLGVDTDTGAAINTKNTHISISEQVLVDAGYPVRTNNEVAMKGRKVNYTDSAGVDAQYRIDEVWPDETLGLIVMILGDAS